jgi:hypothetical protein
MTKLESLRQVDRVESLAVASHPLQVLKTMGVDTRRPTACQGITRSTSNSESFREAALPSIRAIRG